MTSTELKFEALLDAVERGDGVVEAAAAAGMEPSAALQWATMASVIERRQQRRSVRTRFIAVGAVAAGVAGLIAFAGLPAAAAGAACGGAEVALTSPLFTFCANTPALASSVNANFRQLVAWVEAKVGTVGNDKISTTGSASVGALTATSVSATTSVSAPSLTATGNGSVTAGSLTATGATSTATLSVSNGVIQRGTPVITATTNLGLYSRTAGAAVHLVANGGEVRMYGKAAANGTGSGDSFGVNTSGTPVASFGGVGANTPLLPNSFCVIVPANTTCPSGWRSRAYIRWDTEDDNNGDSYNTQVGYNGGNNSVGMDFCCRGSGYSFGTQMP